MTRNGNGQPQSKRLSFSPDATVLVKYAHNAGLVDIGSEYNGVRDWLVNEGR